MKIRTVFQPHVEIDVPDDEAEALRLQGLLHTAPAEPETPALPAPAADDGGSQDAAPAKPAPAKQQPAASMPTDQAPLAEKG